MTTDKKPDQRPRRLGRGLTSLLGNPVAVDVAPVVEESSTAATSGSKAANQPRAFEQSSDLSGVKSIPLEQIEPSPFQPRRVFDEASIVGLAQSIRQSGVLQPVLVRAKAGGGGVQYELVAGERRWRAAQVAGLATIPAIIKALDDEHAAELALVENVQREDLNAMERAWALRALVDRFGLTQAALAERVGLERPTVANLLRLTDLEVEITDLIAAGKLGAGHGKALLSVGDSSARMRLANRAAMEDLSVREVERIATAIARGPVFAADGTTPRQGDDPRLAVLSDLQRQIGQQLGTKVAIIADRRGNKGRIVLEFYGLDHFDALMTRIGVKTH